MISEYQGIFKGKYGDSLSGKDWPRRLEPEDRAVLVQIGNQANDHGRLGGAARARTAVRDGRGHFAREDGTNRLTGLDPAAGTCNDEQLWDIPF